MSKNTNTKLYVWLVVAIVAVVIAVIGIPLLVMGCYSVGNLVVPWTEAEYLLYIGSVLACLGAVFLGVVSWLQNNNSSEISENLLQLERAKYLSIIDVTLATKSNDLDKIPCDYNFDMHKYTTTNDILIGAMLKIENKSEYPIVQCSICLENTGVTLLNNNTAIYENYPLNIPAGGTIIIRVTSRLHMPHNAPFPIGIRLCLTNIFDFSTIGTFYVMYENYMPVSGNFRYAKIIDVKDVNVKQKRDNKGEK